MADLGLIRRFSSTMQDNYPDRLHRCYVYPATPLLWRVWAVAKWFLAKSTRSKIIMVKWEGSDPKANWLRCGFTHEQLEEWDAEHVGRPLWW